MLSKRYAGGEAHLIVAVLAAVGSVHELDSLALLLPLLVARIRLVRRNGLSNLVDAARRLLIAEDHFDVVGSEYVVIAKHENDKEAG